MFIFDLIKFENLQQALLSHSFVGIEDIDDVEVDIDVVVGVEVNVVVVGGDSQTSLLNISSGAKFLAKQNFPLSLENTGEFGRHTCKCQPYLHFCQKNKQMNKTCFGSAGDCSTEYILPSPSITFTTLSTL